MIQKIVWITGASSGIGKALALEYSREGSIVILSSRNEEALNTVKEQSMAPWNCHILPLDLEDHEQLESKYQLLLEKYDRVDILINNGGFSQRSLALETDISVTKRLFDINFHASIILSKLVLPEMIKKNSGSIVNVSSLVGKFGTPFRSSYSASKHALHGYFDSLRAELSSTNVHIMIACPGFIKTNVAMNALVGNGDSQNKQDNAQVNGMSAQKFSKKLIRSIERRKKEVYIGGKEVAGVYLKRFLPETFTKIISRAQVR